MANPIAGTQKTYEQVGIREDLSDMIYDISPTETPFFTRCRKGPKATNTSPEWQKDSLADASGSNKQLEGADATFLSAAATSRIKNYTQIFSKSILVSGTANSVRAAGRKKELAYQTAKRSAEIKRDIETNLTGNYASDNGSAATARALGGLESWYETNSSRGTAGGTDGADGGFSSTTGQTVAATDSSSTGLRTFTETLLKAIVKDIWTVGGEPRLILVGGFNKQKASTFTGIADLVRETGNKMERVSILGAADLYKSDFGVHEIVASRFSRDRTAHFLDMTKWEIRYLRPFKVEPLAKTGDAEKRQLISELTLIAKNEAASGVVADLTTS